MKGTDELGVCIVTVSVKKSFAAAAAKSLQSCLTLCDPIDSSPPGSPVSGILQARTLEWGAIAFSKRGYYIYEELQKSNMAKCSN